MKENQLNLFTDEEQKEIAKKWEVHLEQMKDDIEKGDVTLLHCAAGVGKMELVKSLIESGENVNVKDKYDRTPLHMSVYRDYQNKNIKVSRYLITNGADFMLIDRAGRTPLLFANEKQRKFLLAPTTKTDNPQKFIWTAAVYGHLDIVKQWLELDPSLVSVTGRAAIDYFDHPSGYMDNGVTLFHLAVHNSCMDLLEHLVSIGANINAKDDKGKTPLDLAKKRGNKMVMEYLKSIGGKPGKHRK